MGDVLLAIALDVSGSMHAAWQKNRGPGNERPKTKFLEVIEMIQGSCAATVAAAENDQVEKIKILMYGLGFGNLMQLLMKQNIPPVQEILCLTGSPSPISIPSLLDDWEDYKGHIKKLLPKMGGGTPVCEAMKVLETRIAKERQQKNYQQVNLLVISDGEPTDDKKEALEVCEKIKQSGVIVWTCFISTSTVPTKTLVSAPPQNEAALFMFQLASDASLSPSAISFLQDATWNVPNGAPLFIQVDKPETLGDFGKAFMKSLGVELPDNSDPTNPPSSSTAPTVPPAVTPTVPATASPTIPPPTPNLPTTSAVLPSTPQTAASSPTPSTTHPQKHVMISYQWDVQPIVKKLKESLHNLGYNIWLDIEKMQGSTIDAMAHAVENSDLVLVCMSEAYSNSVNCKREGEYILARKKAFIPLMMEDKYSPTGWLGLMLGARLYHKFDSESDWDTKIANLINEMGNRGKI